jgi:Skp family chaperone for outer membrane proteins
MTNYQTSGFEVLQTLAAEQNSHQSKSSDQSEANSKQIDKKVAKEIQRMIEAFGDCA